MSWELLISAIPFLAFIVVLVYYERQGAKREIERKKRYEKVTKPTARLANGLYEKKYGKPSPELAKEFPELKVVE